MKDLQWRMLPRGVVALGTVSLLMDVSSELVHSLLPLFLTTVLGAGMATVGLIEGIAEAVAALLRVLSGAMSDWLRRRKSIVLFGYALSAASKIVFPIAPSTVWILFGRSVDRMGKGIRGAPRDALIADLTPPRLRGSAFGLRQSLDSVGAFLGPALALLLMRAFRADIRAALWAALLPAIGAVAVLAGMVKEPEKRAAPTNRATFRLGRLAALGRPYWKIVLLGVTLTLARFSEAFVILRGHDAGLSLSATPLILIVMNLVYATGAYPAGALADRSGPRKPLLLGIGALLAADGVLGAPGAAVTGALIGAALWGLHLALTQGVLSKLVADASPPDIRGAAFGGLNLAMGLAVFGSNAIAGALWSWSGPAATFGASALFTAAAGVIAYQSRDTAGLGDVGFDPGRRGNIS